MFKLLEHFVYNTTLYGTVITIISINMMYGTVRDKL